MKLLLTAIFGTMLICPAVQDATSESLKPWALQYIDEVTRLWSRSASEAITVQPTQSSMHHWGRRSPYIWLEAGMDRPV